MYVHYHFLISITSVGPVIPQPAWAAAKYTFLCNNLLIDLVSPASLLVCLAVSGDVSLASTGSLWPCR